MEERDQSLIERYLANELSVTERAEVEQRKKDDPEFRQELIDYEKAREALLIRQREELRQRFRERDKKLDAPSKDPGDPRRFWFLWVAIAAVVVISLLLWKFLFSPDHVSAPVYTNGQDTTKMNIPPNNIDTTSHNENQQKENQSPDKNKNQPVPDVNIAEATKKGEALFAENFEPYKDESMTPVSRGGNELSMLDQFRQNYWDGKYKEAVFIFSKLGASYQGNDNLRFMYANALAGIGQVEPAQLELINIINHHHSVYGEQAQWYVALLYLKQGDMVNARKYLLNCIESSEGYHKKEAKELLAKIK